MTYDELVTAVNDYAENNFPTVDINRFIEQAEQTIYNTVQLPSLRRNVTGSLTAGFPYLSLPTDFLSTFSFAVIDSTGSYFFLLNKDVNFIRECYPSPTFQALPQHYALWGPQTSQPNYLSFILGPTPDQAYTVELHYFFYPVSIIQAAVNTLGTLTGGSGYTNGQYFNVTLTGGTGTTCTADIVVSGGAVTSVNLVNGGCYYTVGDTLSTAATNLGSGTGTGFNIKVLAVNNPTGTTWLGQNFDTALLNQTLVEAITYLKGEADMIKLYQDRAAMAMALLKQLGDAKERGDAYRDGQVKSKVL